VTVTATVWVIVGASLAVAASAAIGYFSLGVFRAVKGLSKEVGRASRSLTDALAPVQAGLARMQTGPGAESRSSSADR
jgi:beta-lactamase regulating signal transducer with metallopeptidase domain